MRLQDEITELANRLGIDVEYDIEAAEASYEPVREAHAFKTAAWERVLDLYGLAAVESAIFIELGTVGPAESVVLRVDDTTYFAGVEKLICTPDLLPDCLDRFARAPSMQDVIPLRGDYLKLFPTGAREFTTDPRSYAELAYRMEAVYRTASGGRYRAVASSSLLRLQAGLWLARAHTMIATPGDISARRNAVQLFNTLVS